MEKSSCEFKQSPEHFIHRGKWVFDTGLKVDLLQEFIFVSLDIFLDLKDNENIEALDELDAWLYFIGSDKPADIQKIVLSHPKFKQMYEEIRYFRYHPEEAIQMFSEALKILDENTVKYMIEEMTQEIKEKSQELEEKTQKIESIGKELEEKDKEIERLKKLLQER